MEKNKYEKLIFAKLYSKYKIDNTIYALNLIDNIIFNERSHLVSTFKDYLILDDEFEFFKRYYSFQESNIRLKNYLNYYSKNKILYPNYSSLREGDIILKNIFIKQKMNENLEKSYEERKKGKNKIDFNENLSNTVFNSKVYDSIINDSENCLSIFSNDKESLNGGNNNDSRNKNDEGINKLLNNFEKFESNSTFSFKKNNDKKIKLDNSLIKELKLDIDNNNINQDNKYLEIKNFQTIYRKKKTPNNSINKRKNIFCNSSKTQRNNYKNENMDYINYKNLVLYSESNHNQINNLYKYNNNDIVTNPTKKINNSALSNMIKSRGNSDNNKKIKNSNIMKYNKNKISLLSPNNKQIINNNIKIGEFKTKNNFLTERNQPVIKVKTNLKKNENNIINEKKKIKIINKNIMTDSINGQQKIKINKNKIYNSNSYQMRSIKNKGVISKINKKTLNNFSNNNKDEIFIKSLVKFDTHRSNSNNILEDNKISLIKKNIDYNMRTEYMINKYKNKLSNYNNYTSIQFNNNNINIINSNSNTINNNTNDIFNNTYGDYMHKSNEMTILNNISNSINNNKINNNKSLEFKNKRKKLNKKCATYFYSNNSEKLDPKFKFKKKINFFNNIDLMNYNNTTNMNHINNLSQNNRDLNSERISTPFNHKMNKKIFFKIYKKVNLSNNKEKKHQKNQTLINDEFKKYKINFASKQKLSDFSTINNTENCDKYNYTHMSLFNNINTKLNSSTLNNNNNFSNTNSSLYKKKRNKNASDIIYYKINDKVDIPKNNLEMNISNIYSDNNKEKRNSNNYIMKRKNIKKDDELLEIKKLDEKKKMIINEFNEKMNQIKLKFIREIENKYEISKRNIINKRRNKNKINANANIYKY